MSPPTGRTGAGHPASALPAPSVEALRPAVELHITFLAAPRSCGLARNAVVDFCRTQGLTDLADDAALLTSELVGNAVEHGATSVTLTAAARAGQLNVWVTDDNATLPSRSAVDSEQLCERGRGLQVIDAIAADWGTTGQVAGKSVWFRLP